MYRICTEQSFDAAHFLWKYEGKCRNIHGHRWRVLVTIAAQELTAEGSSRGMVADFGDIKRDLSEFIDPLDHSLIYETGSLRDETVKVLKAEGFYLVELPFRTTAENFAKYFYDRLTEKGYAVDSVEVWETPNNSAVYTGEE